ncbi:MAG: class I adenylate-forming enzyme family protein, partial [Planctomycetota bacterium]
VAVPLNYRYMPPEIDHALEVSGASILVHHAERDADVAASQRAAELPLGTVVCEASDGRAPSVEALLTDDVAADAPSLPTDLPADHPLAICFTSGSTGKPKGVTHTRSTMGWMFAKTIVNFRFTPDDVILPASSGSHIGAYLFSLAGLAAGCRVDVAHSFDAHEVLALLRQTRPTLLVMLPAALIELVRDHDAGHDDFASLRLCMSGGDSVAPELERLFHEKSGMEIREVYGMTEFGVSHANAPGRANRLGSIGGVLAGYRMWVRDDQGGDVDHDQDGRLWVHGPSVMKGYWNRPDATRETIVEGWLDTGDVVRVDREGYVRFRGRKKQIIVHDGSNISPQEVEASLIAHPSVASAGVIGVHDLVHGENVYAYVTLEPEASAVTSRELVAFSREAVGYKAPDQVMVLDAMPLNATGKVDRPTLKRMAEARIHPEGSTG